MALLQHYQGPAADGGKDYLTVASTAITKGRVCGFNGNGLIAHYTSGTNPWPLFVALEAKASSDATQAPVQLLRITDDDLFIAEIRSGTTPAQTHVGDRCDIHTDGTVDLTATTNKDVTVEKLWDSTHVLVRFNHPIG